MIKNYKTKAEWLADRNKGIGGSDASAVLGKNPYKTNVELWEEKTGLRQAKKLDGLDYIEYGLNAEDPLADLFLLDYPQYSLVKRGKYDVDISDEHEFIRCTPDRELLCKETGELGGLEIKTTEILASIHKEKWNNQVPENYYMQILQYFAAKKERKFVWLKVQIKSDYGAGDIRLNTKHYYYRREELEDDIKYLVEAEVKFWQNVLTKKCPALILPEI